MRKEKVSTRINWQKYDSLLSRKFFFR